MKLERNFEYLGHFDHLACDFIVVMGLLISQAIIAIVDGCLLIGIDQFNEVQRLF